MRSRNLPALCAIVAARGNPGLYEFLQSAGIARMATEQHYGLALALGGGEVTIEELATLYAMLAEPRTCSSRCATGRPARTPRAAPPRPRRPAS